MKMRLSTLEQSLQMACAYTRVKKRRNWGEPVVPEFEKDFIIAGDGDDDDVNLYYIKQDELAKYRVDDPNSAEYKEVKKMLGLGMVLAAIPPQEQSDEVTLPMFTCYLLNVSGLKKHTPFEDDD